MSKSAAAVVVTFNRKVLLAECLNALLSQKSKPDKIFVIDNASTDGTKEYLEQNGLLKNPLISYVGLGENLGGAGGFHEGTKIAYEGGFDWIWVMDDDAEPNFNALEELLRASEEHADVDAFSCLKVGLDNKVQMHHIGNINTCGRLMNFVERDATLLDSIKMKGYVPVTFASFVGFFFSKNIVSSIGLPMRDMFIHHDDLEYCTRIQRAGFKMLLVPKSLIVHKEAAKANSKRNGFASGQVDINRLWINYFGIRNAVWYKKTYCSVLSAIILSIYLGLKFTVGIALFRNHKMGRIAFRLSSIIDGFRGNFDNHKPMRFKDRFSKFSH